MDELTFYRSLSFDIDLSAKDSEESNSDGRQQESGCDENDSK